MMIFFLIDAVSGCSEIIAVLLWFCLKCVFLQVVMFSANVIHVGPDKVRLCT